MARTLNETVRSVTDDYLNNRINVNNPPSASDIEAELLTLTRDTLMIENQGRPKGDKLTLPTKLFPSQIADIMLKLYPIVRVCCGGTNADPAYDLLAIYVDKGVDEGIYTTDEDVLKRIARGYNYSMTGREMSDTLELIKINAPRVNRTINEDLIAVGNGIFDYKTKQLLPFSSDYVFMAKSHVNYNPKVTNVMIHNPNDGTDWDVESWMKELSDDPDVVELLWEVLGAIVRPFVAWNKSVWFYSNTGNNGKGTLCALMRNLLGEGSYAAIPLTDFSKDFALEPLTRATAIITDENDVGTFIDKAANLKAIITHDVIPINRKFKTPISYQFYGFMVQCLNEYPRVKDTSDSFYRRQIFVPFEKCFTGIEREYIKEDYLRRAEVLEYVLYKVLNMNYYHLSDPASCRKALAEYKDYNDPVRQFLDDVMDDFVWDLIPFGFLYDLYKSWFKRNAPNGKIQGRNTFIQDVLNILKDYPKWYCQGRTTAIRPGTKMDKPEPMIATYGLGDWMNPHYSGPDVNRLCCPELKATYNGILRV